MLAITYLLTTYLSTVTKTSGRFTSQSVDISQRHFTEKDILREHQPIPGSDTNDLEKVCHEAVIRNAKELGEVDSEPLHHQHCNFLSLHSAISM